MALGPVCNYRAAALFDLALLKLTLNQPEGIILRRRIVEVANVSPVR